MSNRTFVVEYFSKKLAFHLHSKSNSDYGENVSVRVKPYTKSVSSMMNYYLNNQLVCN